MFSKMTLTSLLLIAVTSLTSACTAPPEIQVTNAKVRQLLGGRETTAAYFTITNNTKMGITLVRAHSPYAGAIEMHQSVITGDRVGMQRVREVTVKSGEQVAFSPGGLHLMVFRIKTLNQSFPITLTFADGQTVDVAFERFAYQME